MAYATKYYSNFFSKLGVSGKVSLMKDGYVGDEIQVKLAPDGLEIDYKFKDWNDPIIGLSTTLTFLNDASDYFKLDDLMTLNEKEFKIIIDASDADGNSVVLFDGWINSDTVEERYLYNSSFRIQGSNYISKLDNVHPPMLDTIQRTPFINIIAQALGQTGKDASILILNTLDPSVGTMGNRTCFNVAGVDTEVFWKNNVERENSRDVINKILIPLDSYLYWYNGDWIIKRYSDAWQTDCSFNYIGYSSDTSVGYADEGDAITRSEPSMNICSVDLTKKSQNRQNIPGLNKLEIKLEQNAYLNLTIADLWATSWVDFGAAVPYPSIRGWGYETITAMTEISSTPMSRLAEPYQQIANPSWIGLYTGVGWYNDMGWNENDRLKGYGVSTRFITTVSDTSAGPTTLNIKWKWHNASSPGASNYWKNEYVQEYNLYWYLRNPVGNYYIKYDSGTEEWYKTSATQETGAEFISVSPADLDQTTGVYEASITIPLTDVSGGDIGVDDDFIFSANYSTYHFVSPLVDEWSWQKYAVQGDFEITVSSPLQNNLKVYEINNNTLNKKKVNLDIFDIDSLNYRNGVYTTAEFDERTIEWSDAGGLEFYTLVDWLGKERFSLYNQNRKRINSDVRTGELLRPMSMWYDYQDPSVGTYLLMSYTYKPITDSYNCEWWQYANDDTNLNYT